MSASALHQETPIEEEDILKEKTRGFVAASQPYNGCSEITNAGAITGRIALMQRGQCMFAEKARNAQKAGAIGGIVIDDNEGSSSDTAPLFQMAGDGKNTEDITIPMLFLFSKEGSIILDAIREFQEVEVLLSDKAKDRDLDIASGEQKTSDNESQNERKEQQPSASQDVGVGTPIATDENAGISIQDSLSSTVTGSAASTASDLGTFTSEVSSSEENTDPVELLHNPTQEPTETVDDPNHNKKWDNKAQPMESILADWKEDIEAFELMEKDEL